MRGETKERWRELCERVVVEHDPGRFEATIQELLRVLEGREQMAAQQGTHAAQRKAYQYMFVSALSSRISRAGVLRRAFLRFFIRDVVSDAPFH